MTLLYWFAIGLLGTIILRISTGKMQIGMIFGCVLLAPIPWLLLLDYHVFKKEI